MNGDEAVEEATTDEDAAPIGMFGDAETMGDDAAIYVALVVGVSEGIFKLTVVAEAKEGDGDVASEVCVTAGTVDDTIPLNPTLAVGDVLGAAVPLAVTVTTTVVTTTTVETLFALVAAAGADVTRGVEEVRSAVPVPVDTTGEVDGLKATLPAPVEVPELKGVAGVEATEELVKALVETMDAGLLAEELATLVCKAVLA